MSVLCPTQKGPVLLFCHALVNLKRLFVCDSSLIRSLKNLLCEHLSFPLSFGLIRSSFKSNPTSRLWKLFSHPSFLLIHPIRSLVLRRDSVRTRPGLSFGVSSYGQHSLGTVRPHRTEIPGTSRPSNILVGCSPTGDRLTTLSTLPYRRRPTDGR